MHKTVGGNSHIFLGEALRLAYDLEKQGQHTIFWESVRKVDKKYTPLHGKSLISVELSLKHDGGLQEAKIVNRSNSLVARFDSNCKLIEGSCSPEHWLIAEGYAKMLEIFLRDAEIKEKSSQPPPPAEILKPMLIKTETAPPSPKEEIRRVTMHVPHKTWRRGKRPLTPSQIEERRRRIEDFCKEKGIDLKNHPCLYKRPPDDLTRIVAKAEEKKIPFTPYCNFLAFTYVGFSANLQSLEQYKVDPVKYSYALVYPPKNIAENLKTCAENKRDSVKEALVQHLNMRPEKFKEFLKSYVQSDRHLPPEEKAKMVIAIMVKNGVDEKDIRDYVKKKSPKTVEKIIEVCNKYEFDWKNHQIVFGFGPGLLDSNLGSCAYNHVDPVGCRLISELVRPREKFKEILRDFMAQIGLELNEPKAH